MTVDGGPMREVAAEKRSAVDRQQSKALHSGGKAVAESAAQWRAQREISLSITQNKERH